MKTMVFFITIILAPLLSQADLGLLGRDVCTTPISSFSTSSADTQQSAQVQVNLLENNRITIEAEMTQISQELSTYQGYLKSYFGSPWVDAMLAHMDNGYDCCDAKSVAMNKEVDREVASTRKLAAEVVNSYQVGVTIPAGATPAKDTGNQGGPPEGSTSCYGFSNDYCSNSWTRTTVRPKKTDAPACLQGGGFVSTPAWDKAACLHSGEVDPQVCMDARISQNVSDHKNCVLVLKAYRAVSLKKRQTASNLSNLNLQIQTIKYPNRPSSEVTNGGDLAQIGNILGSIVQTFAPVISQYLAYSNGQDSRYRSVNSNRPMYRHRGSKNASGPPEGATYYGPNYGYAYSFRGNYGGQPPGRKTGTDCSAGVLGNGLNLMSQLLGGGKMNFQNLASMFGTNGGSIPNLVSSFLSAVQMNSGYTAPYQPGGVYSVHSGPPAGSNRAAYSQYLNGNAPYSSRNSGPPAGATLYTTGNSSGSSSNNFDYSQLLMGLMGNTSNNMNYLSGGYQQNPYYDMASMLGSLFSGNFNVNAQASYGN